MYEIFLAEYGLDPIAIDTRWTDEMFLLIMEKLGDRKKREAEAANPNSKPDKRPMRERLRQAGFTFNPHKKKK
jgi:hypothetical protein